MTFKEILAQVIEWLQHDQRVSYRALKRQFALDNAYLEDLKYEHTSLHTYTSFSTLLPSML